MLIGGDQNLVFKILNDLDDKSLVNYCKTNKKANKICNDQIFWMNRLLIKFPYIDLDLLKVMFSMRA